LGRIAARGGGHGTAGGIAVCVKKPKEKRYED
jgi:hypothetical protein